MKNSKVQRATLDAWVEERSPGQKREKSAARRSFVLRRGGEGGKVGRMEAGKFSVISLLGALGLFFVPWLEVRCSPKTTMPGLPAQTPQAEVAFLKQSGFQVATGSFSFAGEMPMEAKPPSGSGPRTAWLIVASAAAAVLALLAALGNYHEPEGSKGAAFLGLVALGLAVGQMVMGFPIEEGLKEQQGAGSMKMGDPMAGGVVARVALQPGFYSYLAALTLPAVFCFMASRNSEPRERRFP